jgi:Ca2+-binding RTX toxin-like protein
MGTHSKDTVADDHGKDSAADDHGKDSVVVGSTGTAAPAAGSSSSTATSASGTDDHGKDSAADDHGKDSVVVGSTGTAAPATLGDDGFSHRHGDLGHRELHGDDASHNAIRGSSGDDVITGGSQSDVLEGGHGSDDLRSGSGDDVLVGGGSDDVGHNHLEGGGGDDILVAGGRKTRSFDDFFATRDVLKKALHADAKYADVASILDDTLVGSVSLVENRFAIHSDNGNDLILNFHTETDKIVLDRVLNGSTIKDAASMMDHLIINGGIAYLDLGHGNSIMLVGVDASSLSAANFVIV